MFFGRTDAKAETPVFWPPYAKSWLIGKDSDAGGDWGQEEKGMTEDEMAGWHHGLDGCESEWTPGVGDGQGGLACCDSWGHKELDTTERLNWTELKEVSNSEIWKPIHCSDSFPLVHLETFVLNCHNVPVYLLFNTISLLRVGTVYYLFFQPISHFLQILRPVPGYLWIKFVVYPMENFH